MKIERMDKGTGKVDFVTLTNCIEHTEGRGYWRSGTVRQELEKGNGIFTPFYIYNKAKEHDCNCSTPLTYSTLSTECLRCDGDC